MGSCLCGKMKPAQAVGTAGWREAGSADGEIALRCRHASLTAGCRWKPGASTGIMDELSRKSWASSLEEVLCYCMSN